MLGASARAGTAATLSARKRTRMVLDETTKKGLAAAVAEARKGLE